MKKSVLFLMALLLLAFSLAIGSCDLSPQASNRAFIGTWTTSQFSTGIGGSKVPATVVFTASGWTLTAPSAGISQSGQYKPITDSIATLTQDGLDFGSARVSSTALEFTCTSPGALYGAQGQFAKQ
jgi:hypothetical protein